MHTGRHILFIAAAAIGGACMLAASSPSAQAQAVIAPGTTDLLITPPELTATVDPNIVVTFDDSGSMASHYMGDGRPFDNAGWASPWGCAGTIDPRITATGDIRDHAMNGVYYNPNVLYVPPVKADGTAFPNADATLQAVWADGVAVNRPRNPVTPATSAYNNNPDSAGNGSDTKVTNLLGILTPASTTVTSGSASGRNASCPSSSGNTVISGCNCSGSGSSRVCTWTATTTTPASDKRWTCGFGSYPTAFAGGEDVAAGGPYYYRLKDSVSIEVDAFGNPTTVGRGVLYTTGNWEAVSVPNSTATIEGITISQWQNFANWYAYYRTRNLMTRTALSRTFAKFNSNVRIAWQNINDDTFKLPSGAIITKLLDKAGVGCSTTDPATSFGAATQPDCYRSAFFNWVFQTGASGTTPDRASTIRAGDFFKRSNTSNLQDPYWQLADVSAGTPGRELACRQNFHMLVTDGYWNESDPTLPTPFKDSENSTTLGDGTTYDASSTQSRVFWDVDGSIYTSSLANIAFNYWAQDLRTDLANKVKPFVPDKTTGITGPLTDPGADPLSNKEVYYNPANDPATWQHVVQFMVTLGIAGKLNFSDDVDCANPANDLCKLRKGQANSAGITGWPRPSNNAPPAIDDTWHAAINSRGSYFSASNPGELVSHLEAVINSVLARGASSTPLSVSLPLLAVGTTGYNAGYDSSDWSGSLIRELIDPATAQPGANAVWDAGCKLTGGSFDTALRRCTQPAGGPWASPPGYPSTARAPDTRRIFTSTRDGSGNGLGIPFRWNTATLGTTLVDGLNQKPTETTLCSASNTVACDAFGSQRVDYLRGLRMNEATASPHFRTRSSVFGAVINSKPLYVSSPRGGFYDIYPVGSPEQAAFASNADNGYAAYQFNQRARTPMVYVGSNDGMLHAFNATTGDESWAYVPSTLIQNRRLARSTADTAGLLPGVDAPPLEQDVFVNGAWHTYVVGTLRLGGRGVFALDVTNVPASGTSEAALAPSIVKWEFNSGPTRAPASVPSPDPVCAEGATTCPSLGYTYDSTNIARIHKDDKWVVLVSSGYFPSLSGDAAIPDDASEPAAKHTSLLVIDLVTGKLIREIRTDLAPQTRPSGFKTFGLSTPVVYDVGSDQVDDYVYAGDLAGNLWRFDISSIDATQWKVDLMFTTYGDGGATTAGDQPIVFNPTAMRDPVTRRPIILIGSGKYLGRDDRTSAIPQQAFYGIRDYAGSSSYPIRVNQLVTQTITQAAVDANGVALRSVSGYTAPTGTLPSTTPNMILRKLDTATGKPIRVSVQANGWRIPLNIAAEPGERADRRAIPDYSPNVTALYSMIPLGDDPCDPGRRFGVMFLDAATGAALSATGTGNVGAVLRNPTPIPDPVVREGGGEIMIPGLPPAISGTINDAIKQAYTPAPWHRGAWKELLDLQ